MSWSLLAHPALSTPQAMSTAQSLQIRGGGGVYTGSYGTAPPSPIYAKHTTINGSRPSFIVLCVIAGLVFIALLSGAGYFWYFRRRKSESSKRYSTARKSGVFPGISSNRGAWKTLDEDVEDDAFAMPLGPDSTNVSMLDLNDPQSGQGRTLARTWNPVYAASGDSIAWQDNKFIDSATTAAAAAAAAPDSALDHSSNTDGTANAEGARA